LGDGYKLLNWGFIMKFTVKISIALIHQPPLPFPALRDVGNTIQQNMTQINDTLSGMFAGIVQLILVYVLFRSDTLMERLVDLMRERDTIGMSKSEPL
jgi:hypothetical protein